MNFRRPLQTVTPTLDGDVLTVLARADTEMSGREIQRMAGKGSHQGIRNAADRLTSEGILERRSAGNAHMYRLNRDHVAAPWIEQLANLLDEMIDRLRGTIAEWSEPPLMAMLFGSVAAGTATASSDIDLLVVRPAGCDPDGQPWSGQLADLEASARSWTGHDARILEFGEEELTHAGAQPVLRDALRDGIELYGSRRTLRKAIGVRGTR